MLRKISLVALIGLFCAAGKGSDAQTLNPRAFGSLGGFDSVPGAYVVDTNALTISGPNGFLVRGVRSGNIAVFAFDSIRLNAGSTLTGGGSLAVALLSASDAAIAGTIDVSGGNGGTSTDPNGFPYSRQGAGGVGGYAFGPGLGLSDFKEWFGPQIPGGGGGFGGSGGGGWFITRSGVRTYSGGTAYGNIALRLEGGSGGGSNEMSRVGGGGGGGAVGIGAWGALTLTGTVRADGGTGGFHGAGGGVLLQGDSVTLAATGSVLARGGHGAGGTSGGGGRVLIATRQEGGFTNAGGTLSVAGANPGVVTVTRRPAAPRFDLLGEGRDTILWQNAATGDVTWWRTDGTSWTGEWGYIARKMPDGWKLAASADLDGDGDADLIWQNPQTGDLTYWRMEGAQWSGDWGYIARKLPAGWKVAATTDLDGDGQVDLVWRNDTTGDVTYWRMEGATWTGEWGFLARGVPSGWRLVGAADVTGDAVADLIWQDASTGDVTYWRIEAGAWSGAWGYLAQNVPAGRTLVGLPDLDGDWQTDLLWRDAATGDLSVWKLHGPNKVSEARVAASVPLDWNVVGLR